MFAAMRKSIRRRTEVAAGCAAAAIVASAGAYTGMRHLCETHGSMIEILQDDSFEKRFNTTGLGTSKKHVAGMMLAVAKTLDAAHEIGHIIRESWDKTALNDVMAGFHDAMKPQPVEEEEHEHRWQPGPSAGPPDDEEGGGVDA